MVCPGSGKTALARALGNRLGAVVYSSDRVRKELGGLAPTERAAAAFEAGIYAPQLTVRTYARLGELAQAALDGGTPVVLDATFREAADRQRLLSWADSRGVSAAVLLCECPEAIIRERLERRAMVGEGASDADWRVYLEQRERFESPTDGEAGSMLTVDTAPSLADVLERVLKELEAWPI